MNGNAHIHEEHEPMPRDRVRVFGLCLSGAGKNIDKYAGLSNPKEYCGVEFWLVCGSVGTVVLLGNRRLYGR
jgi:hypothetical protein